MAKSVEVGVMGGGFEIIGGGSMIDSSVNGGYMGGSNGMDGIDAMGTGQVSKADELMGSWVFVGGITAGVLVLGVLAGLFCAKRKIKKGIDLYED